jgi:hypothetical protein
MTAQTAPRVAFIFRQKHISRRRSEDKRLFFERKSVAKNDVKTVILGQSFAQLLPSFATVVGSANSQS